MWDLLFYIYDVDKNLSKFQLFPHLNVSGATLVLSERSDRFVHSVIYLNDTCAHTNACSRPRRIIWGNDAIRNAREEGSIVSIQSAVSMF